MTKLILAVLMTFAIGLPQGFSLTTPRASDLLYNSYDVIVVGAGTGGVSAAIQAARMGAKVALLEETDWIGGQVTASGLGSTEY